MTKVYDCYWHGRSNASYTFEVYLIGQEFRPVAGVYVLATVVPVTGGVYVKPLYVGETQSFYDRLNANARNHDGFKRALALGATHVAVRGCNDVRERLAIETDLRHGLNPPCNAEPVPTNALVRTTLRI